MVNRPTRAELKRRAMNILGVLAEARNHLRCIEVSKRCGLNVDATKRLLFKLEDSGIVVAHDEPGMTTRWGLADRVIACPDCRRPMSDHVLARRGTLFEWRCPR